MDRQTRPLLPNSITSTADVTGNNNGYRALWNLIGSLRKENSFKTVAKLKPRKRTYLDTLYSQGDGLHVYFFAVLIFLLAKAGKSKSGFGFKSGFDHFSKSNWIWIWIWSFLNTLTRKSPRWFVISFYSESEWADLDLDLNFFERVDLDLDLKVWPDSDLD